MKIKRFGILIRVRDLVVCRAFYRDLLHLGEPVMDSTFAVEFALSGDVMLRLESNVSPALEHASSAVSWCLETDDPEKLFDELANTGYRVDAVQGQSESGFYFRGEDPEGNPFFITRG